MCLAICLALTPCRAAVTINEFLPNNGGGLQDEDLQSPGWIELYNSGPGAVNLAGWRLTDDAGNLAKWTFPATNLPAGGYLVVFTSGKNRANPGWPLHSNFQLSGDGEYLALVQPGGSVAHAFAPSYPNLRQNISYGLETSLVTTTLLATGAAARVFVPTSGVLGTSWTSNSFNDAAWTAATTPASFVVGLTVTPKLSIDVTDRSNTSGFTEAGFTSFIINSNVSSTAIQTQATVRVVSGVTITLSNTAPNGYDDRLRGAPLDGGAFTESLLLRDFVSSQTTSGSGGLDVTLSGLLANQLYRFTIWSYEGAATASARVSDWSLNGVLLKDNYTFTPGVAPADNDDYRFSFEGNSTGAGAALIAGRRDATSAGGLAGVYLNALKVEQLTVQAPTNPLGTAMFSNNATAYIRVPFSIVDPNVYQSLKLRMRYDDGFVAYINGQLVASRNAPGSPVWNSTATTNAADSQSLVFEDIVIGNTPGLLQAGSNVLAIHGLNVSAADLDFFILPELQGIASGVASNRFFASPTPGAVNGASYLGIVADTKFSVDRGFYDTPFTVAITSATATASIYWTTNGSVPSLTNGTLYTAPVSISGTRLLRAAAFLTNYIPSVPDTHSYIFLSQVFQQSSNQPAYPATWQGSFPADYGMDPFIVSHTNYGVTLSNDMRAIPTLSLVSDHDSYWHPTTGIYVDAVTDRGERATSAEMFLGDNTSQFQINCAIQMHGQAGRDNARTPKHSFRLEFKSDYGPSKLDYDWYGGGVTEFDSVILRSSWADTWTTRYDPFSGGSYPWAENFPLRYRPENGTYLRDQWVKEAMMDMNHLASRGRHVHLYVNGLYWGIYNVIERLGPTYFANHLGGYEKDWDILKDNSELQDGSRADWDSLITQVNLGIADESAFQAVASQVDMDNLVDYFLLHALVEANDWLQISNPHNSYWVRRRANATNGLPATKWVFLPWDQEIAFNRLRDDDRVNGLSDGSLPSRIYNQLRVWPEFRRIYGDRAHKQMFNGGALSPSNNVARLQSLAAEIDRAIVGESARWGDAREFTIVTSGNTTNGGTGVTLTRDEWWVAELQKLYTNWFPNVVHQRTIARLQAAGLYPSNSAPVFSQFGGAVSNGFALAISHTNASGLIYFTTDGSDPRVYGTGAIAGTAQSYSTTIPINAPTLMRARVFNSGNWSALTEAVFYPPQDLSKLALTEIMYNPPAIGATTGNNLEFLELKNTGTNTLNLSGLTFTSGITFTFTNGTTLAPGQFFVLARNAAAFASKYGAVTIHGTYTGQLDNAGESLALSHALGTPIFSVTYDDRPEWPVTPDVANFSLVQTQPGVSQAPDRGNRWRASTNPGGSPGADDPAPSIAPIVISEVLAHTDLPQKDSIELHNPTGTNVSIGGWYLTDEPDTPAKFRIPNNTIINAGARIYFDEDDFNAIPGTPTNFLLSSTGDDVHLFSATTNGTLTGYSHSAEFGASFNGISFGRYVNSAGDETFPRQISGTFGAANSGPVIGPVVISEIHYNPETNGIEFVELLNITGGPVQLFSAAFPTNAWKLSGADFTFPTNLTLAANSTLLVVATNEAAFRARYSVPTNVVVLGPFGGQLQDGGENVELQAPDNPNTNAVPYVTMDAVRYNDKSPWPPAADGSGMSLQRSPTSGYGNEPTNWIAAAPTPGQAIGASDSDNDGLPDAWEDEFGTQKFIPDAGEDPDGDGLTNGQEYLAGTHPNSATSALRFTQIATQNGSIVIQFLASSNRTYSLLYKTSLGAAQWSKLADISAHATNRVVTLTNTVPGDAQRFYRLVTPAQAEGFSGILRMETISANAGLVAVGFGATSNRSYTVQYKASLSDSAWLRLKDVPAQPSNHNAIVTDNTHAATRRFYRAISPTQL